MPSAEQKKAWSAAVTAAAGARAQGAGWVAEVDDAVIVAAITSVQAKPGPDGILRASWTMSAKPLALDPLLWTTLGPDQDMGSAKKQLGLRVVGAFAVTPIPLGFERPAVDGPGVDLQHEAQSAVDSLTASAREHAAQVPDLAAFAAVVDAARAERPDLPYLYRDTRVFTAIAMGDLATARTLVDEALAQQERTFSVGETTLWQMLDRDLAAGTGVAAR